MAVRVFEAEWTWTGERLEAGLQVAFGDDGRIAGAGALGASGAVKLERRALVPGLVNAHSHAFQLGLRGRGETYPEGSGDFWSWREAMYELVAELDENAFFELTRAAFRQMRRCGMTAVGEFHYLHHAADESGRWALDDRVLQAAREAGIRLVLLQTFYRWGGAGDKPLAGAQRRFATPDLDAFWRQVQRLSDRLEPRTQHLGVAAHSLRAVNPDEAAALWREARRRELPFHMHVEEQRREVEECRAAWGDGPLALVVERLAPDRRFTAVHATHSRPRDLEALGLAGGGVCLCPTTEASLADGIPDLPGMLGVRLRLSLGSDSNQRISMTEEMRWLEWVQRLARERRGVVRSADGDGTAALLAAATTGGAASLGLRAGRLEAGCRADALLLDLDHPALAHCPPSEAIGGWIYGGADEAVAATAVAGAWEVYRPTPGL